MGTAGLGTIRRITDTSAIGYPKRFASAGDLVGMPGLKQTKTTELI